MSKKRSHYTPDRLTKRGVIEQIVKNHLDTPILHDYNGTWYVWDGKRWRPETGNAPLQIQTILLDANDSYLGTLPKNADKELRDISDKLDDNPGSLVNLAKTMAPLACNVEQFDQKPFLLNCANGTLDLTNGRLTGHYQDDYLTRVSPIAYDSKAKCPTFDKFLQEIFDGDTDLIEYVVRMLGYSLTGDSSEQKFWV